MKIKNFLIAILTLGVLASCSKDYLDINDSPVDPTQDIVAPDLLLAGALHGPYPTFATTANDLGNAWMQNWGPNVNAWTGGYEDEFRFRLTTSFGDNIWDNFYRGMSTLQSIIDYEGEDYDNHKAIARVMKSFYFQYLVDLYGDVPYTEALQKGEILTPAYDDSQAIYRDLIVQLDMALATLKANEGDAPVGAEDIVFQGDLSMWVKFANTLKLRILLRQSELAEQDGEVQSYLNSQFASLEENFLTQDATINPGYADAAGKQNPFYAAYGFDSEGNAAGRRTFDVAAEYAANFLKGDETENGIMTGVYDLRVERLYEVLDSAGEVVGIQQGATATTAPDELSYLGPGLIVSSEQPGYLITAAESFFLQSEAAFRGYISGDAKALFQEGIIASFEMLDVVGQPDPEDPDAEIPTATEAAMDYIAASNNINLIGWDGSANKIEAIMTQKWIALNGINGIEAFIEYNRTGYPDLPLPIIAEESQRPFRLLYPASEYSNNSANVAAQNQSISDAFSLPVFWDVE